MARKLVTGCSEVRINYFLISLSYLGFDDTIDTCCIDVLFLFLQHTIVILN